MGKLNYNNLEVAGIIYSISETDVKPGDDFIFKILAGEPVLLKCEEIDYNGHVFDNNKQWSCKEDCYKINKDV